MRQIANLLTGVSPRPRVRIPPCPPTWFLIAVTLLLATTPGCVTRKLFLRSEPSGARVLLDGRPVGTTPYVEEFQSYGVRRLELRLEGHERLVTEIDVWRPWWQYLPFALITDVLWPFAIHDERSFEFAMTPLDGHESTWEDARAAYERLELHKQRVTGVGTLAPGEAVIAPNETPTPPDAQSAVPQDGVR